MVCFLGRHRDWFSAAVAVVGAAGSLWTRRPVPGIAGFAVSRRAAQQLLAGCNPGTFLVRSAPSSEDCWTGCCVRFISPYSVEYDSGVLANQQ